MARARDRALKLFVVLNRAAAAVTHHAEVDVTRHGISLAEFASLEALYHKGPLLVGELQRAVLKSSGGMTYVVDRLSEKGLVRRRPCDEDRRALYAELTEEGTRLMERIFPDHARAIEGAMKGLSPAEQQQAVALLRKLGRAAAANPGRTAAANPGEAAANPGEAAANPENGESASADAARPAAERGAAEKRAATNPSPAARPGSSRPKEGGALG